MCVKYFLYLFEQSQCNFVLYNPARLLSVLEGARHVVTQLFVPLFLLCVCAGGSRTPMIKHF